jgi:predicted Rossmann-fold nucleotide-binding protein
MQTRHTSTQGQRGTGTNSRANDDKYRMLDAIHNLESLSLQALLLIAGNNATLFLSNKQPDEHRDRRHEPLHRPSLLHHFTSQPILKLFRRYQDKPKLCVNGTSSDAALLQDVDIWLNRLAPRLVKEGVGHICGGAVTGAMGAAIRAFVGAIKNLDSVDPKDCPKDRPEVATVLLKLLGAAADREKPQELHNWGLSSVKQWSWMTRTPALHGIGQQNVMAFLPGGLGTLFEVFYPLAARQFASKGIVGIFDENRPPSEFVFISSSTYTDGHFWKGTEDLLAEMVETRACRREFSHITMFDPNEGDDAIEAIVEHYRNSQSPKKERAKFDKPTKEFAMVTLEQLTRCGLAPRDTTDKVSRPFFALLDNVVAAHMTLYHLRNSIDLFQKGKGEEATKYRQEALQVVGATRDGVLETLERLSTRPAVQLVGSTKDHFWTPGVESYSREVIRQAVATDSSVVLSGSGTEGLSQRWTDLWVEEKRAFFEATGKESLSELVRVQASYTGEEVPQREFQHGYKETLLPTVLTLDTRNELANAIGSKQAFVLAPGGHAEVLAFVQAALNRQLFGKMYTPYEQAPVFHVLDVATGEGRHGFYAPLLRQLEVMERYQTIKPTDYDRGWFIPLKDPKGDAQRLFDQLVSTI